MMSSASGISLGCDARHRLSQASVGALVTNYGVNVLGQRVSKSGPLSGAVEYVYDLSGRLLGSYGASGAAQEEIVWLGALPVASLQNGAAYYIAPDHLGASHRIINTANQQVWFWDHDPFGQSGPNTTAGFKHNLRFPGQIYDPETGLHYNGFRDYSPALGRYVESDPIGLTGGINTYAYVGNDPLNHFDQLGLNSKPLPEPGLTSPCIECLLVPALRLPRALGLLYDAYQLYRNVPQPTLALPAPPPGTQQAWTGTINSAPAPSQGMTAYRVWGGQSGQQGSWLTPTVPTSSTSAKSNLALPPGNTAASVSPVQIPGGTQLQYGTVAPAFEQPGGGVQLQLLERIPESSFGPGESLPWK